MPQFDSSGGRLGKKKKSASPGSNRREIGPQKHGAPPEPKIDQAEPPSPVPVSRLGRTRRLLLAALKVWDSNSEFAISPVLGRTQNRNESNPYCFVCNQRPF